MPFPVKKMDHSSSEASSPFYANLIFIAKFLFLSVSNRKPLIQIRPTWEFDEFTKDNSASVLANPFLMLFSTSIAIIWEGRGAVQKGNPLVTIGE
jgi:hypothetical protein